MYPTYSDFGIKFLLTHAHNIRLRMRAKFSTAHVHPLPVLVGLQAWFHIPDLLDTVGDRVMADRAESGENEIAADMAPVEFRRVPESAMERDTAHAVDK